jgi:hypothetical protein
MSHATLTGSPITIIRNIAYTHRNFSRREGLGDRKRMRKDSETQC